MNRNWKSAVLALGAVTMTSGAVAQSTTEVEAIVVSVDPVTNEKEVVDVITGEIKQTLPDMVYQVGARVVVRLEASGNKAAIQGFAHSPLDDYYHS